MSKSSVCGSASYGKLIQGPIQTLNKNVMLLMKVIEHVKYALTKCYFSSFFFIEINEHKRSSIATDWLLKMRWNENLEIIFHTTGAISHESFRKRKRRKKWFLFYDFCSIYFHGISVSFCTHNKNKKIK